MPSVETPPKLTSFPLYAHVVIDESIDKILEYGVPSSFTASITIGMRVSVKVRNSLRKGTIVALTKEKSFPIVSPILDLLSERLLPEELLQLAQWMSFYYCSSLRKIFKFLLPSSIRGKGKPKEQYFIKSLLSQDLLSELCSSLREKHPSQAKVLETLLKAPKGMLLSELLEKSAVSKSPIDTLIKQNTLTSIKVEIDRTLSDQEYFISKAKTLYPDQQLAYERIIASLDEQVFKTHLIHGVTGSGKTEIYLQAIDHARQKGYGTLMLVPEIALTTQMIERFRSRFQEKIAIYHHRLSDGERYDMWNQIQKGTIQIVLGARSAVFLPIVNLKLIIVDEEHETSYKQSEENPCYHARDVAIMRASFCKATIALGSATPSLESYHNAQKGKYLLTTLKSRIADANLPKIHLVDMQLETQKSEGFTLFSPKLLDAIAARFKIGEQVLLFLNRRGYHSFLICSKCHEIQKCPDCDVSLTFHQKDNSLTCHYCDYRLSPPPKACKACKEGSPLLYRGFGTEQVENMLKRIFPTIRTLRMDADTTRHKGSHNRLFKEFRSGKADVLIGTQMIAKGFHFPSVTLVGVLNSDNALHTGDFRASEHLFQLLVQVSGRSGRGELPGEVFIQTFMQEHKIFSYVSKEDYIGFYEEEIASRKLFSYPPFTHLAKITFTGDSPEKTLEAASFYHLKLIKELPSVYTILPVIPDRIAKVKKRYRYYFMVKGPSMGTFSQKTKKLFNTHPLKGTLKALVDVDC
jgi:primosomal protein N' (replication factor Y) (superfamily II helicase)